MEKAWESWIIEKCETLWKWWKMMKNDEKWWKMMKNDEKWWKMMKNDEKFWKMMKNDEKWWKMMKMQLVAATLRCKILVCSGHPEDFPDLAKLPIAQQPIEHCLAAPQNLGGSRDGLIDWSMMVRGVGQYKYPNGLIKWVDRENMGKCWLTPWNWKLGLAMFSHV